MPPEKKISYVSTHVHTDGPIPGPHSLLTVTASAWSDGGGPRGTFTTNVRELPGATLHPVALQEWRLRAEDWLVTRRSSRPPAVAMSALARWLDQLPGSPVLVADTTSPDYLFVYWYLQRFTGRWPFTATDSFTTPLLDAEELCPLRGCRPLVRAG
jgi:hypothetical protein